MLFRKQFRVVPTWYERRGRHYYDSLVGCITCTRGVVVAVNMRVSLWLRRRLRKKRVFVFA